MQIAKIFTLRENSSGPEGASFSRNSEGVKAWWAAWFEALSELYEVSTCEGLPAKLVPVGDWTADRRCISRGFPWDPFRDSKQNSDSFTRWKTHPRRSG